MKNNSIGKQLANEARKAGFRPQGTTFKEIAQRIDWLAGRAAR